ncbi:MAG: HPr family phosphocarrier protein [Bauldia sp.]
MCRTSPKMFRSSTRRACTRAPSAHFVRCAERFDAIVTVSKDQSTVGAPRSWG